MRGLIIFAAFFIIFSASTIAIPAPMFPGNVICTLLGIPNANQILMTSAITNGIFYGSLAWIIFSLASKWIENNLAKNKLERESN